MEDLYFEDMFDDDLEILDVIENGFPRRVHQRKDYLQTMNGYTFFRKFRLYKDTVMSILEKIDHGLEYPHNLNNSVSPINQLLIALRYYATGCHLNSLADFGGMDTSTVSRIIVRVSELIAGLYPQYIKMPDNLMDEQVKFFDIRRFPRIVGAIDGTHIKISNPGDIKCSYFNFFSRQVVTIFTGGNYGEVFRDRRGFFSINTQAICDSDMKWPDLTHDSRVFMNSRICARFENGDFGNGILLGDSGYPLRPFLLTPLEDPVTQAQQQYNQNHIGTRNIIERSIGVWKSRFPCLAYGMRLKTETALTVITATAVLHNIARLMNEPEPPVDNRDRLNYLINLGQMNNPGHSMIYQQVMED